jgi:delta 1-pyrroline-5-carboxylate dehydrogenase
MFEAVIDLVKASRPLQFALVFVAGGTVAALFYPTKTIQEKLQKTYQSQISTLQQQHSQEISTLNATSDKKVQELTQTNSQLTSQVTELTSQVSDLKSHQQKNYTKIVHPDGTIEITASTETDSDNSRSASTDTQTTINQQIATATSRVTQDYETKISTMQKEWDSKEQSYQSQISTLTQSKTVTINPKNFTLDVGALTNADYYGHVTYAIWGPFILGLQAQFGSSAAGGAGIGLRF